MTTDDKKRWPASEARLLADELVRELRTSTLPTPEHMRNEWLLPNLIAIAGSLRRGKEMVGDIEILYVPKVIRVADGFFDEKQVNVTDRVINSMIERRIIGQRCNSKGSTTWGPLNKLAVHIATGIPIDFFSTTAEDWFTALVIRTGPKESNIELCTQAPRHGHHLHAYGSFTRVGTGEKVVPSSEREVFSIAGVPWKEPKDR